MFLVATLSTSDWVSIALVAVPLLIGAYLRNKQKADKSDIMIDVESKIESKISPIKAEVNEIRYDLSEVKSDYKVIDSKLDSIDKSLESLPDQIKELRSLLEERQRQDVKDLWAALSKKQDKK